MNNMCCSLFLRSIIYKMPVAVRPLPAELAEKARVELFEDPKKLEDSIAHLKDWISKQPHLRARTDDQWLAAFLRGCKFSLERAKQKIDLYYTLRTLAPELCGLKPSDPKFMEILKSGFFLILPKLKSPTGPRVFLMRGGILDPVKYPMVELMSIPHVLQQIMFLEDDAFMVSGGCQVMDFKGTTLAHFSQITPSLMKKMVVAGQEAAPVRMKGAYYLYMPSAVETIFNMAKSFLNEKNRNRLHVFGKDIEPLYEHIPKDILPAEYGGNGGTVQEITDYWVKKVEEYKDWLEEDQQYGTDESKRPGKPKTAEDTFGVDGSFRQLDFD